MHNSTVMKKMTSPTLRQNLFNAIKRLLQVPEQGRDKLARLKKRSLITGDAATLPDEKAWEWGENASRT